MKIITKITIIVFSVVILTSCYDRDIIDAKDFNKSLPDVEGLDYTKEDNSIQLMWQIPTNISEEFIRPVEVSIQVVENNIYRQKLIIRGENSSTNIFIDPNKEYRFIVKLLGFLKDDVKEDGFPDKVYSEGKIVKVD